MLCILLVYASDPVEGAIIRTEQFLVSRIPIHERVELPESWIPADSRVEIDAKITAGKLPLVWSLIIRGHGIARRTPRRSPQGSLEDSTKFQC